MAEHFVGPVMKKLIDSCFEYLKDQLRWQTGMKEELDNLRRIHPQIEAVVCTCSEVEIKDSALNKWYWQLRDAIDEADDILDEFEYSRLEKEVSKKRKISKVRFLMKYLKKKIVKISKRALKVDPSLKKLEEALHNLYMVSNGVSTFQNLLDRANQEQQQQQLELRETRETGSMTTNELLGRSEEIVFVREWLRKPYQTPSTDSYKNISLLSVVGHGGMGKTTLLQHAYEDEMMNEFDVKIWICVSQNFNAKTVIKNMLESFKKEGPYLNSLESLQRPETLEAIGKTLEALRRTPETLEALQRSLRSEVASKRFLLVLDDIWEDDEREWKKVLDPLSYGSSASKILITTRMDSVASTFAKMTKKNKEILRVKGLEEDECSLLFNMHAFAGVENPDNEFKSIARKMVKKLSGCPLAAKVIGGVLNSEVNKSYWTKVLNTNIGNVGLDQNHLLPILNLSYRYLPKFLQNCFSFCCIFKQDHEFDKDDLVRMWIALGFIQPSNILGETLEDTGRRYFNILVQKSFFDEFHTHDDKVCYKMHDLLHEMAQSVSTRECFRFVDDKELSIPHLETIRHLSIDIKSLKEALKKMGKFKNLRSLFLHSDDTFDENVISEILKSSKNIRLLVISDYFIPRIPETVGCLIHLRYLKVKSDVGSSKLPRCVNHLYHLQFIICSSIRKLKMDRIGWKELMPNENCKLITDGVAIKDPSVLLIDPLGIICSFRYLTIEKNNLLVSFSSETEQWFLRHRSSFYQLEFERLRSLQSLPSSFENLSSLRFLHVYNVPQLKLLPNPPASLTTLLLYKLPSLQCLPSCLSSSSLTRIILCEIPLLKSLPDLPASLKELRFIKLESLQCLPSSLSTISTLEHLTLKNIPLLESLPDLPSSLKELDIHELKSLKCLPSSLSAISSLETLELKNIPLLKSLPDLPSSLSYLYLKELESLDCLPSSLPTALNTLKIKKAPRLLELPDLPSSLNVLSIKHCHRQLRKRYQNFDKR